MSMSLVGDYAESDSEEESEEEEEEEEESKQEQTTEATKPSKPTVRLKSYTWYSVCSTCQSKAPVSQFGVPMHCTVARQS